MFANCLSVAISSRTAARLWSVTLISIEAPDGQVIRIQGNPLPGGGFVMLFSDVTAYKEAERVLKESNLDLEAIITERTKKLEKTNEDLDIAREKAEQAHIKKSLYLKACSHDLMQPLEAARLFTSALSSQGNLSESQFRQVKNIDHSLKVANDLLSDLGEIARIESGNITAHYTTFSINDLFKDLAQEFSASAEEYDVEFRVVYCKAWITSDRNLLRRILQNLIRCFRDLSFYSRVESIYMHSTGIWSRGRTNEVAV